VTSAAALAASVVALIVMAPLPSSAVDPVPPATQLLAQPFESTGVRVSVSNVGEMLGLATDATLAYVLRADGSVVTTPLSDIPLTAGSSFAATGTVHSVGWGVDGAPSLPGDLDRLSISYASGCLWITSNGNTAGSIGLSCIDVTDWSVTDIAVPVDKPLPAGYYFTYSSLIDFPDGRIGKVSRYEAVDGGYESVLRTYTVTGEGSSATIAWSRDYVMFDTENWATDEHGIATDGTYLYRIQWRSYTPNTKVWALTNDGAASIVYSGQYTMPFDNMHYLAHNHVENYYLVGHYRNSSFFITTAADPGPGPGNPLTPTTGAPTSTSDGCTVQVSNYAAEYTWGVMSDSGAASIDETGLVTITGLDRGATATVIISTARAGYPDGSAQVSCTALPVEVPSAPVDVTAKGEAAQVSVAWNPPTDDGGSPIIGYEVELRDEFGDPIDGATCTTTDLLYCTVTGLVDGITYEAVVRAINAEGAGAWSSGQTAVAGAVRESALPEGPNAADLGVDDATPREGQTVRLTAEGFRPGSQVDFWLHSTPVALGAAIAGIDGTAVLDADLPEGVVGAHTVQALGVGPATGSDRNLARSIVISAAPAGGDLAISGTDAAPPFVLGLLLLAAGLALVARRRGPVAH
jgi:hypothetical protein